MASLEPLGGRHVATPGRTGPGPRRAKVLIAAGPVELLAPKQPRGDHGDEPVPLLLVVAREVEAPEGVEPLEWILLTRRPAGELAEATTAIDYYACRPIVEEFHKAMKAGCGIETLQFRTEAALQPAIALLSVVAVFLLTVRDAARDPQTAGRPATEYVPGSYAAVLCAWRHGEVRAGWTIGEFYYALGRLGGHQNRRSDRPPGWLVLSRGGTLLQAMVQGVEAMGNCRDPAGAPPGGAPSAESGP